MNKTMSRNRSPFNKKYPISETADKFAMPESVVSEVVKWHSDKLLREMASDRAQHGLTMSLIAFCDNRIPNEYLYDVVDGWLGEVLVRKWLDPRIKKLLPDVVIESAGADADRVIQYDDPHKISTEPDLLVRRGGIIQPLEIQVSHLERNSYDMKDGKAGRACKEDGIFLWVVLEEGRYFLFDPYWQLHETKEIANKAWNGKMVYRLPAAKTMRRGQTGDLRPGFDKDLLLFRKLTAEKPIDCAPFPQ